MRIPRLYLLVTYFRDMAMKPEVNARILQVCQFPIPRGVPGCCNASPNCLEMLRMPACAAQSSH